MVNLQRPVRFEARNNGASRTCRYVDPISAGVDVKFKAGAALEVGDLPHKSTTKHASVDTAVRCQESRDIPFRIESGC